MNRFFILGLVALFFYKADARETYNFNSNWLIDNVKNVTLPHAWNEDESFKVPIAQMSDTVVWYRKHFYLPKSTKGQHVFIEFEGARQAAEVWLNGHKLGMCENGVMAFGFELTRYIKRGGKVWIKIFPEKPVTHKPMGVRMGKGKGALEYWVAVVKPGRVLFEISGVPEDVAKEALRLATHKLPCKCKVVSRADLEGGESNEN